jgi:hypothetical protein
MRVGSLDSNKNNRRTILVSVMHFQRSSAGVKMRAQMMSKDIRKRLNINCIPTVVHNTEIYHMDMVKGYEKVKLSL